MVKFILFSIWSNFHLNKINVIFSIEALYELKKLVKKDITSTYLDMATKKRIKDFDDLNDYPDLREAVVPAISTLPSGSMNTKVIINEGKIVERVFKTPKGEIISLFASTVSQEAA